MRDFKDALGMVLAAICVSGLIAAPVACNHDDNDTIRKLVAGGTDPLAARCAILAAASPNLCSAYVLRGGK